MSWQGVPRELVELAEATCTAKELDALKLKAAGVSNRGISRALGISSATGRDRLERAFVKIRRAADEAGIDLGTLRD